MYKAYKKVKDAVKRCPLLLLSLTDKKLIDYANSFLPRSVGIEFETPIKEVNDSIYPPLIHIKKKAIFELGKYGLIDVSVKFEESSFRIPAGIEGMICLYHLSLFMKTYYYSNSKSGIHYHLDYTKEWYTAENINNVIDRNNKWMMESLKHWNYTGNFNEMKLSTGKTAIRMHPYYNTIEYRIGEMTFDYSLLIKRIINCQNITDKLARMENKVAKGLKLKDINNKREIRRNNKPKKKLKEKQEQEDCCQSDNEVGDTRGYTHRRSSVYD